MLAGIGFLGIAMSSFVMIGRDDFEEEDTPQESEIDTTGLTEIEPGLFQMLSDNDGDDPGAGGVLPTIPIMIREVLKRAIPDRVTP
jgi:hypothetical protein